MPKFVLHFTTVDRVLMSADLIVQAKNLREARRIGRSIEADQDTDQLEVLWQESDVESEDGITFESVDPGA